MIWVNQTLSFLLHLRCYQGLAVLGLVAQCRHSLLPPPSQGRRCDFLLLLLSHLSHEGSSLGSLVRIKPCCPWRKQPCPQAPTVDGRVQDPTQPGDCLRDLPLDPGVCGMGTRGTQIQVHFSAHPGSSVNLKRFFWSGSFSDEATYP